MTGDLVVQIQFFVCHNTVDLWDDILKEEAQLNRESKRRTETQQNKSTQFQASNS